MVLILLISSHWGERPDYENEKKELYKYMKVEPVSFAKDHKGMLAHAKMLLEQGYIAINPAFDKLITSLRTVLKLLITCELTNSSSCILLRLDHKEFSI